MLSPVNHGGICRPLLVLFVFFGFVDFVGSVDFIGFVYFVDPDDS